MDGLVVFNEEAWRVVARARELAESFGDPLVGPEHVLVALAEGDGVAARVLHAYEIEPGLLRRVVQDATAIRSELTGDGDEYAAQTRAVLRTAVVVAAELRHVRVGAEHLLLALAEDPRAADLLALYGVGAGELRAGIEIERILRGARSG